MTYYEIKKIFSKTGSRVVLLVLPAILCIFAFFMIHGTKYIDEQGEIQSGFTAIAQRRAAKKEWAGILDEKKIRKVLEQNISVDTASQLSSAESQQQNLAYAQKQGTSDIRELITVSYGGAYNDDRNLADKILPKQASEFYSNRIKNLDGYLETTGNDLSKREEKYIQQQYEMLETPWYYDYQDGWQNLFDRIADILAIITLALGFLCAGIFSGEFRTKASAIFFSSYHGRRGAILAKVKAGFLVITVIYLSMMLLYSALILGIFGADGANCPIQSNAIRWRSFYNITNWQAYLLIVGSGYLGCLFILFLTMLVSAKTNSTVIAVIVPSALIFFPAFLSGSGIALLDSVLEILPHMLLNMDMILATFRLYELGGRVFNAASVLTILYVVLTLLLIPVLYLIYRKKQVY